MAAKKEEKVPYMIPLSPDPQAERETYCSLNGKGYRIQHGKKVMIPKALAEILDTSREENYRAFEIAKQLEKEYIEASRSINAV